VTQQDGVPKVEDRNEELLSRAKRLKRDLSASVSTVDKLIDDISNITQTAAQFELALYQTREDLDDERHKRVNAEESLRIAEAQRIEQLARARQKEEESRRAAANALSESLRKIGQRGLLSDLDKLVRLESSGQLGNSTPTIKSVQTKLEGWIKEITRNYFGADLERMYSSSEVTVDRESAVNLCEFEPSIPFSDAFPRARCTVVACGWRAGDLILEKARLRWIEQLPTVATDEINDQQDENVYVEGDAQHPETDILVTESEPDSAEQDSAVAQLPVDFSSDERADFVPSLGSFREMRNALEQSAWYGKQKPRNKGNYELILDAIQSGKPLDVQSQSEEESRKIVEFIHHDSENEYSWLTKLCNELEKLKVDIQIREYVAHKWQEYRQIYPQRS
jgi:uncharacterized protein YoxC